MLDDNYVKTLNGKNVLAFDDGKIIGFATDNNIRLLCASNDVQCDATFKTASILFHQLYTLHVTLGSGDTEETVSVIYALLPDKRKETYRDLFMQINSKCQDFGQAFNPQKIRLKFESVPICVIEDLYPTCRLSGCTFQFNQCLWRKVQNIGLSVQYAQTDGVVRGLVRSVAALVVQAN